MSEFEIVGRQCFPSDEMKATPSYRKLPWIDGEIDQTPSRPGFYTFEPLIRLSDAQSELAALREELAEWKARCGRRVADIGIVVNDKLDLQQRLTAAEQRNSDLIDLIRKAHTWVDRNNFGGWDAYELRDQLAAALKPTESGASE